MNCRQIKLKPIKWRYVSNYLSKINYIFYFNFGASKCSHWELQNPSYIQAKEFSCRLFGSRASTPNKSWVVSTIKRNYHKRCVVVSWRIRLDVMSIDLNIVYLLTSYDFGAALLVMAFDWSILGLYTSATEGCRDYGTLLVIAWSNLVRCSRRTLFLLRLLYCFWTFHCFVVLFFLFWPTRFLMRPKSSINKIKIFLGKKKKKNKAI